MEVCVIKPSSMEDTREIADTLVDNSTVILNLEGIDVELAQRIIDFTSGCIAILFGTFFLIKRVDPTIFCRHASDNMYADDIYFSAEG